MKRARSAKSRAKMVESSDEEVEMTRARSARRPAAPRKISVEEHQSSEEEFDMKNTRSARSRAKVTYAESCSSEEFEAEHVSKPVQRKAPAAPRKTPVKRATSAPKTSKAKTEQVEPAEKGDILQ